MPRELWKGAIRFGLVNIPVGLYPAEQSEELSFTMLDRRDLQPVGYKRYNKTTGDEVAYENIVKGYEYQEGVYVTLEKDDFKRANVEATQTVDIIGFVDRNSIAPYFYASPYYLGPGKHGDKGYALLRETLLQQNKVGIANVVIRTRAHIAALYPVENVLVLNTLRYATELRSVEDLGVPDLKEARVTPRELDMAQRLVEDMDMTFDPTQFRDTYRDDILKLIEEKAEGIERPAPRARAGKEAEIIDFAELLERSLKERGRHAAQEPARKGAAPRRKAAAAPRTRRKTATAREGTNRRAA